MRHLLPQSYYSSDDVLVLAKDLLGKLIKTRIHGKQTSGIIVETEAYKAPEDKGSHAFGNKRTKRTESMFTPGGHAYIYLCYGIHHLFNVVVGPPDAAHAILIRAIEPIDGIQTIKDRRSVPSLTQVSNGPGKLSSALGINTAFNQTTLFEQNSPIQLYDIGQSFNPSEILESPRVGIAYAKEWAHKNRRFRIKNNMYTSLPHQVSYS